MQLAPTPTSRQVILSPNRDHCQNCFRLINQQYDECNLLFQVLEGINFHLGIPSSLFRNNDLVMLCLKV